MKKMAAILKNDSQSPCRKNTIILLVDWCLKGKDFWLKNELEKNGFQVFLEGIPNYDMRNRQIKWRKLLLWWQYFTLGWRGAKKAKRHNGIVLSWNFIPGIFCAIFSEFIIQNYTPIVSLNMIAFKKGLINNIIRDSIYKFAFKYTKVYITVNSEEYRQEVISNYHILPHRIKVLNDPIDLHPVVTPYANYDGGYVFSGGEAARDWETFIRAASMCPEIPFKIITRRKSWKYGRKLPSNIEVYFDTSEEEFYSMTAKARIVILTLSSLVTAGLIVLKNSILLNRLIIVTETPATKLYFPKECRDLLVPMGEARELAEKIKQYWCVIQKRQYKTNLLKKHLINNFSQSIYVSELINFLKLANTEKDPRKETWKDL